MVHPRRRFLAHLKQLGVQPNERIPYNSTPPPTINQQYIISSAPPDPARFNANEYPDFEFPIHHLDDSDRISRVLWNPTWDEDAKATHETFFHEWEMVWRPSSGQHTEFGWLRLPEDSPQAQKIYLFFLVCLFWLWQARKWREAENLQKRLGKMFIGNTVIQMKQHQLKWKARYPPKPPGENLTHSINLANKQRSSWRNALQRCRSPKRVPVFFVVVVVCYCFCLALSLKM